MITRAEILRRARAVPQRSDAYSQSTIDGDGGNAGYRPDCSGWVSYCWGVPKKGPGTWGGYSTSTFVVTPWAPGVVGIMYEIPRASLKPGDAIGHCTPTSGGDNGHIALWLGKDGSRERILDHGGGMGPLEHTVTWGVLGTSWNSLGMIKAWRFRGVEDALNGTAVTVPVKPAVIQPGATFPLPTGQYYGLITGPAESHGGFYAAEQPIIAAIQVRLMALGYAQASGGSSPAWADGRFEQPTADSVKRLQRARNLKVTGHVAADTWHVLFAAPATPPPVVVTPPVTEPVVTPPPVVVTTPPVVVEPVPVTVESPDVEPATCTRCAELVARVDELTARLDKAETTVAGIPAVITAMVGKLRLTIDED